MLLENKIEETKQDYNQEQAFIETKLQLSVLVSTIFSFKEKLLSEYIKLKSKNNNY